MVVEIGPSGSRINCGIMPQVACNVKVSGATSNIGQVVVIKSNGRHSGCAVQFPGLTYDTWFSEEPGTDKRSKYMSDLNFIMIF